MPAKMCPVDPNHQQNVRDDGHTDFSTLKAKGQIRTKRNAKIGINEPKGKWSAVQRDQLYQAYCEMMKSTPSDRFAKQWIAERAGELKMSVRRAVDIINEGNGQHPGANMQWWRGVSLPEPTGTTIGPR